MVRRIINIDKEKCNGCGACANACHEGAIAMIDGKASLIRDDYCDGLGNCLPVCPTDAISFVEREAATYDEKAVKSHIKAKSQQVTHHVCPGSMSKKINHNAIGNEVKAFESRLSNWPVQIKLAPVRSDYFDSANLLISADCAAYTYGDFHNKFIKNKITLIGCPKLDTVDYSEKLTEIIRNNDIKSVTVVRMEVPCCGGIETAVKTALQNSGKFIPWQVVTISTDGQIIE